MIKGVEPSRGLYKKMFVLKFLRKSNLNAPKKTFTSNTNNVFILLQNVEHIAVKLFINVLRSVEG